MNERIRELATEAEDYADGIVDKGGEFHETYTKKFAELIVRECANTAYQSLYEDRVFDDSPANIRRNVMDSIKKHFGVEE